MADIVCGRISARDANAAVNAGGKMLQAVELTLIYGKGTAASGKNLNLLEGKEAIG